MLENICIYSSGGSSSTGFGGTELVDPLLFGLRTQDRACRRGQRNGKVEKNNKF